MIVIGRKYKIDEERLKWYCDEFGWSGDYIAMCHCECVIVKSTNHSRYNDYILNGIISYFVEENDYYYPEDCLIDLRELKLKKILCR